MNTDRHGLQITKNKKFFTTKNTKIKNINTNEHELLRTAHEQKDLSQIIHIKIQHKDTKSLRI